MDLDIGVDEGDDGSARRLEAAIASVGRPARTTGEADDQISVRGGNDGRIITARVIDDDQFPGIPRQIAAIQRAENLLQVLSPLVYRNDNREAEGRSEGHARVVSIGRARVPRRCASHSSSAVAASSTNITRSP